MSLDGTIGGPKIRVIPIIIVCANAGSDAARAVHRPSFPVVRSKGTWDGAPRGVLCTPSVHYILNEPPVSAGRTEADAPHISPVIVPSWSPVGSRRNTDPG